MSMSDFQYPSPFPGTGALIKSTTLMAEEGDEEQRAQRAELTGLLAAATDLFCREVAALGEEILAVDEVPDSTPSVIDMAVGMAAVAFLESRLGARNCAALLRSLSADTNGRDAASLCACHDVGRREADARKLLILLGRQYESHPEER